MPFYKMNGKRDGKQKYRVRINYLDSAGKPHQIDRVTYGLEEAKLLELQLAKEVKDEAPAKRMTLQQLFDEYIKARKGSVRESTLDKAQRILKRHVLPELGGVRLHKLTTPVLMQWKMGMEQKRSCHSNPSKRLCGISYSFKLCLPNGIFAEKSVG